MMGADLVMKLRRGLSGPGWSSSTVLTSSRGAPIISLLLDHPGPDNPVLTSSRDGPVSSDMMGADLVMKLSQDCLVLGWSSSSDMMGADLVMKLRQDCPVQDGPVVVI